MTGPMNSPAFQALIDRVSRGDRSTAHALHALIAAANAEGVATVDEVAVVYRRDYLSAR